MEKKKTPELLAPAGTREALEAAVHAGADAVYFGGSRFNARMSAENFAGDAMGEAIRYCAFYGVKTNITLNTLAHEKELGDVLRYAEMLCRFGADAVICADLGLARLLRRYFPELPLHASTQCSGHNTDAARFFANLGFSRMVAARELSFEDLKTLCRESPIETELFIHGAICVSQSGGCLFSSLVGGRSGNRGACAQPCRLQYEVRTGDSRTGEGYPLSLRDMCLGGHIPELLSLGASSLKIEGRMKGPQYVAGVVSVYRRLLDEGRCADKAEIEQLAALFSRGGGFTDGYFRGKTGSFMQGVRTETDKAATVKAEKAVSSGRPIFKKIPVSMHLSAKSGEPAALSMTADGETVTVFGDVPLNADHNADEAALRTGLSKLGATPFAASDDAVTLDMDEGCFIPLSALNALRRECAEKLEAVLHAKEPYPTRRENPPLLSARDASVPEISGKRDFFYEKTLYARQASFLFADRIPACAKQYYDLIYLPLDEFCKNTEAASALGVEGVILPPVIFDSERKKVRAMLEKARQAGISHALIANAGHIGLAKECGFTLHGDLRLNVYSGLSADVWTDAALSDLLLSPELSAPQMRDIRTRVPHGAVTYGRIPLMTLQRCILREAAGIPDGSPCNRCEKIPVSQLVDRKKTVFPVTRSYPHRNIVWNSVPVYMADRAAELVPLHLDFTHHIFTVETAKQAESVMRAYEKGTPFAGPFRKI